jgi:outer membrane protein
MLRSSSLTAGAVRRLQFLLLASTALLTGMGARADAASLTEALAATYTNNPTILAERARLRATDEQVPQALSSWRPTVQFTGSYAYQNTDVSGSSPDLFTGATGLNLTQHPRSVDLQVAQPIYRGGRTVAATARAENLVRAERSRAVQTEQQAFLDTITAYMNVLRDQALLELSVNNEQVLRRQLEATQDRFRVGEVTRTDVAQAESRLSQARSDRETASGNLEVSRSSYVRVVGEAPGKLTAPAERPALPVNRQEMLDLASTSNPAVMAALFTEAAARDNVRLVRGELLPTISIIGDINRGTDQSISTPGETATTGSVIARLTMPLYEGGSVYSRSREAQETVGQRRSEIDDARRQAVDQATQAWESMQSARARVQALRSQIQAAEIALEGVQQEAEVGSRTVLDILNAEQELFSARTELVRAQRDELVSEFQLTGAVGRLTAVDLNLPVPLYDVDKHYNAVRNKWIGFGTMD